MSLGSFVHADHVTVVINGHTVKLPVATAGASLGLAMRTPTRHFQITVGGVVHAFYKGVPFPVTPAFDAALTTASAPVV